jgi:two-component system, cell cycle response regulator
MQIQGDGPPTRAVVFEADSQCNMSDCLPENDPDFSRVTSLAWVSPVEAVPALQESIARARGAGQELLAAYGLGALTRAHILNGNGDAAAQAAEESLRLFRRLDSRSGEACGLMARGLVCSHRGQHAQALETLNLALDLARESTWPDLQGGIGNLLGVVLNDMGRHAQSAAMLGDTVEHSKGPLSPPMALRLRNNLALALSRQARTEREAGASAEVWRHLAARAAQLAAACAEAYRSAFPWDCGTPLESLASALVVLDELDEAHRVLDEAEQLVKQADDHYMQIFVNSTRARAWLQGGRPDAALQAADEGIAAAGRAQVEVYLDDLYLLRTRALEGLRRFEEALQAHKQFHAWRVQLVLHVAEERAQALAVTLDTARAAGVAPGRADRAGQSASLR